MLARRWRRLVARVGSHLFERAAQQPRDVHLADADAVCDLRLRQAPRELQLDDVALPVGELRDERGGEQALLDHFFRSALGSVGQAPRTCRRDTRGRKSARAVKCRRRRRLRAPRDLLLRQVGLARDLLRAR